MVSKDFNLIAFLMAKGCKYANYQVDELSRVWFSYEDAPNILGLQQAFYRNDADVRIQDFVKAQSSLKTLIFDLKHTGNEYGHKSYYSSAN